MIRDATLIKISTTLSLSVPNFIARIILSELLVRAVSVCEDVDVSEYVEGMAQLRSFVADRDALFDAVAQTSTDGDETAETKRLLLARLTPPGAIALLFCCDNDDDDNDDRAIVSDSADSVSPWLAALQQIVISSLAAASSSDSWLQQVVQLEPEPDLAKNDDAVVQTRAIAVRGTWPAGPLVALLSRCCVPNKATLSQIYDLSTPAVLLDHAGLLVAENRAFLDSSADSLVLMRAALATLTVSSQQVQPQPRHHSPALSRRPSSSSSSSSFSSSASSSLLNAVRADSPVLQLAGECAVRVSRCQASFSVVEFQHVGTGANVVVSVRNRLVQSGDKARLSRLSGSGEAPQLRRGSMSSRSPPMFGESPPHSTLPPLDLTESSDEEAPALSRIEARRRSSPNLSVLRVIAIADHIVPDAHSSGRRLLPFRRDESFTVTASGPGAEWYGYHKGRKGFFARDLVFVLEEDGQRGQHDSK
jgi:hypothetical protein